MLVKGKTILAALSKTFSGKDGALFFNFTHLSLRHRYPAFVC